MGCLERFFMGVFYVHKNEPQHFWNNAQGVMFGHNLQLQISNAVNHKYLILTVSHGFWAKMPLHQRETIPVIQRTLQQYNTTISKQ